MLGEAGLWSAMLRGSASGGGGGRGREGDATGGVMVVVTYHRWRLIVDVEENGGSVGLPRLSTYINFRVCRIR